MQKQNSKFPNKNSANLYFFLRSGGILEPINQVISQHKQSNKCHHHSTTTSPNPYIFHTLPGGSDSPLMEVNKTKKRLATGDVEAEGDTNALKKLKKGEEEEEAAAAGWSGAGDPSPAHTEEEVEEFFAILRRMKVAVDYFDQKGRGDKEWREVLEQAEFTVDDCCGDRREADGAAVKESTGREVIVNESFDLNAVAPEAAADAPT